MTEQPLQRVSVPELDLILGRSHQVLDKGFVRVVDYMGGDASIVQAARVSYGDGTKSFREDRGLIRYLMSNLHTSPMEHCIIKLHIKLPIFVARQWMRHRTWSYSEVSYRYSEAPDEMQETDPTEWRLQAEGNRQGSGGFLEADMDDDLVSGMGGSYLTDRESEAHDFSHRVYESRLAAGVAREQARKDLPVSLYTEFYATVDLHNLFHFLYLRDDAHAQQEIREYASMISLIVQRWVPLAYEAFVDYRQQSLTLSRLEVAQIYATQQQFIVQEPKLGKREQAESEEKLARLGIMPQDR